MKFVAGLLLPASSSFATNYTNSPNFYSFVQFVKLVLSLPKDSWPTLLSHNSFLLEGFYTKVEQNRQAQTSRGEIIMRLRLVRFGQR